MASPAVNKMGVVFILFICAIAHIDRIKCNKYFPKNMKLLLRFHFVLFISHLDLLAYNIKKKAYCNFN